MARFSHKIWSIHCHAEGDETLTIRPGRNLGLTSICSTMEGLLDVWLLINYQPELLKITSLHYRLYLDTFNHITVGK